MPLKIPRFLSPMLKKGLQSLSLVNIFFKFHNFSYFSIMLFQEKNTYCQYPMSYCKVCSEKKCTRICLCYSNQVSFWEKPLKFPQSRHLQLSKMVRQVHIAQKMTPVGMIIYKKIIHENTNFVKKNSGKRKKRLFSPFLPEIAIQL